MARREWTFEDLESFADDVRRELDDNTFFEMPSPTLQHQRIVLRLAYFLSQWSLQNGGEVFLSPVDLVVSPKRVFIPDLCFYGREKMATGEVERDPKRLRVAPDLVVEILLPSTASRDRVLKFRRYAEFGVHFYWIIDPRDRILQAFELDNGRYRDEAVLGERDSFSPALFPGLTLQIAELLGASQPDFPQTGE
jgi:Uma2 family endonuclease